MSEKGNSEHWVIISGEELSKRYDLSEAQSVPEKLVGLEPGDIIKLEPKELVGHGCSSIGLPLRWTDFTKTYTLPRGLWKYEGIQETLAARWRSFEGKIVVGAGTKVAVLSQNNENRAAFLVKEGE